LPRIVALLHDALEGTDMKRAFIACLTTTAMAFHLAGCGSDEPPTAPPAGHRVIAQNVASNAAWTPDGQRIICASGISSDSKPILVGPEWVELVPARIGLINPGSLAMSPDGSALALAADDSAGATNRDIFLVSLPGLQVTKLSDTPADESCPSWAPDGSRLVFQSMTPSFETRLEILRLSDHSRVVLTGCPLLPTCPSWSPDGTRIAFFALRPDAKRVMSWVLYTIAEDGTQLEQITSEGTRGGWPGSPPSWSPDSARLAFEREDCIWVVDREAGTEVQLVLSAHAPAWSPAGGQLAYITTGHWGGAWIHLMSVE
jgi:Tol biopolymer transport system component